MLQEPEYVFVVGTAHFSEKSADDAERVIEVCHRPTVPDINGSQPESDPSMACKVQTPASDAGQYMQIPCTHAQAKMPRVMH